MPDDPYRVLGVRADADAEAIRQAYLRLARAHHPDFFVDASPAARADAEARMRAVNEAWAILGDRQRRAAHDTEVPRPFEPFETPLDDEPDPRDQPDVPYRPAPPPSARRQLTTLAPAVLFGAALASGAMAMVTGVAAAVGLAVVFLVLSAVGFLVLPLLALGQAKRDEG
jgi:hypothetical protein